MADTAPLARKNALSGTWFVDATGNLAGCHFFSPGVRADAQPVAVCGRGPVSPSELAALSFTRADYPASKADCLDCRRAIGEDPRDDYARRPKTP